MPLHKKKLRTGRPGNYWIWKQVGMAALTALLIYFIFVFLHQGVLLFQRDVRLIFNRIGIVELISTFFYLLGIILVQRGISSLVHSLGKYSVLPKAAIEAVLVVISSMLLLWLVVFLPFRLIFPEVEIEPGRERLNFIFMAILALFFYYFVERQRGKRQLQTQMLRTAELQKENFQAELQTLKNQMNPHFLFNSLNVLGSLIQKDQQQAGVFLDRLSEVYRSFLENSEETLIPLEKEMEVAKAYMYLLQTRFGKSLIFINNISEDKMQRMIPPGSVQMLLENAEKHNGFTSSKPLLVEIFDQEDRLVVKNKLQPRKGEVSSTGMGLENIRNRYRFLTDDKVVITKTEEAFWIELPLLQVES